MKAAHDGVDFLNARYFHRLTHGIHDADMAAGADDNEALVLQIETGGVLMDVLVGHDLALHFGRQVVAPLTTGPPLELELHHGVREHFFDAVALDLACRERLAADHDRRLAHPALHVLLADIATVAP